MKNRGSIYHIFNPVGGFIVVLFSLGLGSEQENSESILRKEGTVEERRD